MNRCRRFRFVVLVLMFVLVSRWMPAQEVASPPLPVEPYNKNDKGVIVVEVRFGQDGKAAACRVLRSNAPYPLEVNTVDAIKSEWNDEWLAGQTVDFPITFDELPWYATKWDENLVPPPNQLPPGDPGRKLKLRITFGADGWVDHVKVLEPSGIELVDQEAELWVKVHWHNDAFANRTLDVPFDFKAPIPPKPTVAKAPPPAPKPVAPAAPAESAAPPAVRVE
jgi:hypothetical protein